MQFTFDATYTVTVTARPIIRDGQPCRAWCDFHGRRILIADAASPRDRLLRHECWHAWAHDHSVPEQADPEELAEHIARFGAEFDRQFGAQGGAVVLNAITPADREVTDPMKTRGPLAARALEWRHCGACSAPVAPGSIDTEPPAWNVSYGCFVVGRKMECEACGAVTTWNERATVDGTPTGEVCEWPKPTVRRGGLVTV